MNKIRIRSGDKCLVNIDWGSGLHKQKRVEVIRVQTNGTQKYARVRWIGKYENQLEKEYGTLFNINELIKIEKDKNGN